MKHRSHLSGRPPAGRRRLAAALPWLLLGVAVVDWALLRSDLAPHPPWVLALLVGSVVASLLARAVYVAMARLARRHRPVAAVGEMLAVLGLAVTLGAGTANWMLGLQGFIVLHEGEAVPLAGGSHLQAFVTGPLARLEEMDQVLALDEVELLPAGDGSFYPLSHLRCRRGDGEPERLEVAPRRRADLGSLRFYQGAFGFAPRIVILRGEETVFDRVVPFTTERHGPNGVSFVGHFTLEKEDLEVRGSVDLRSLDEALRGHATLELAVVSGGEMLGRGSLLPGHFAEMERGYQVGFAGLRKWSEIILSRRDYTAVMLPAVVVALLGGVLWLVAGWRGW